MPFKIKDPDSARHVSEKKARHVWDRVIQFDSTNSEGGSSGGTSQVDNNGKLEGKPVIEQPNLIESHSMCLMGYS